MTSVFEYIGLCVAVIVTSWKVLLGWRCARAHSRMPV